MNCSFAKKSANLTQNRNKISQSFDQKLNFTIKLLKSNFPFISLGINDWMIRLEGIQFSRLKNAPFLFLIEEISLVYFFEIK